jgi:hypothetical protein
MSSETPSQPAFPESSGRVRTPRDTGSIESPSGIGRYAAGSPVRPTAGSATQGSSAGHGKLSGVQPLRKRKWHEGILGKLGVALAFVFAMLLIPAGSGLYGLYRFREVVHDLDYGINEAPHQADLVTAIGALVDPVLTLVSPDETAKPAGPYFQLAHQQCQGAVVLFRRKLAAMPEGAMTAEARAVTTTLLDQIDKELAELDVLHVRTADATLRPVVVRKMHELVSRLVVAAQQVPDPVEGMRRILSDSRRVYSSTAAYIIGFGGAGALRGPDVVGGTGSGVSASGSARRCPTRQPGGVRPSLARGYAGRNRRPRPLVQPHDAAIPGDPGGPRPAGERTLAAVGTLRAPRRDRLFGGGGRARNQQPPVGDLHGRRIARRAGRSTP